MSSFLSRLQQMSPERRQIALRHLAAHLVEAGRGQRLIHLLTSFDFLAAKVASLSPQPLVEDYTLALRSGLLIGSPSADSLELLGDAIRLSATGLEEDSAQLAGQLYGRLLATERDEVRALLRRAREAQPGPWLRPVSQSLTPPGTLLRTFELSGPYNVPYCLALLPGEEHVLSGWLDGRLRVLELESGSILRTFGDHDGPVYSVAVSPDGSWALSASTAGTVRLWDLDRGRPLSWPADAPPATRALVLLADGEHLLGGEDQSLRLWHLPSGRLLWSTRAGARVQAVAASPDGESVFAGLDDGKVKMWSSTKGGRAQKVFRGHQGAVRALAISADCRRIVTGSSDRTVRLWDIEARGERKVLEGHLNEINAVVLSPDGRYALSGGGNFLESLGDNGIRLWDLEEGCQAGIAISHTSDIYTVCINGAGDRLFSASRDGTVKVWDVHRLVGAADVPAHAGSVTALALLPGDARGGAAVSASRDGTLKVWNLGTASERTTLSGHTLPVNAVAVSGDGRWVASGAGLFEEPQDADHTLRLWDVESGLEVMTLAGHTNAVTSVALTPDARRAVSGAHDYTVRVWDLEEGIALYTLDQVESVRDVAVTPDGRLGVSAVDGLARLTYPLTVWDIATGVVLFELEGHDDRVNRIVITLDSRHLISASSDRSLMVWDLETGKQVAHLQGHSDEVFALAVTPDSRHIISGSADRSLRMWELESGRETAVLDGIGDTITAVLVSQDGRYAVATAADGFLSVWDLADLCLVARFRGDSWLTACAISDDGETIVCGEGSGRVHILKLEGRSTLAASDGGGASW